MLTIELYLLSKPVIPLLGRDFRGKVPLKYNAKIIQIGDKSKFIRIIAECMPAGTRNEGGAFFAEKHPRSREKHYL